MRERETSIFVSDAVSILERERDHRDENGRVGVRQCQTRCA